MRALFIHAHFDDFEFTAAGTFELWRRRSAAVERKVVICTDGKGGHQFRTREETGAMRWREQQESARIGQYECEVLRLPDGQVPREACVSGSEPAVLAALWKVIRDFEPDYLFCPPLPSDPLAGVHVDHLGVAEAVRKVAYLINVPHAFTPEYPADETISQPCKVPVILNVFDPYTAGANTNDFAVDAEEAFSQVCQMAWCHQSQIAEWLPWVGRHNLQPPASPADWERILRARFARKNQDLGLETTRFLEFFTLTGWGAMPTVEQLMADFPTMFQPALKLEQLRMKIQRFNTI